jgi:hypothetical protein
MEKKLLGSLLVLSLAFGVYAQGTITLDNINNNNTSLSATSGGLFFVNGALENNDFNVQFYAAPTSVTTVPGITASQYLVATFLLSDNTATGGAFGGGQFLDPSSSVYTLSSAGSANVYILAWTGNYNSYAAALAANTTGVYAGASTIFTQGSLGGGLTAPTDLTAMPAVNMVQVPVVPTPEPSTLALAGLGGFGMLMAMRRKKA